MSKRRSLSADGKRRAKKALWKKSGGKCFYCGVEMHNDSKMDETQFTLDHLIPLKDGGNNKHENFVAACRKCNSDRGSKRVAEFVGVSLPEFCKCEIVYVKRMSDKKYRCVICKKEYLFKEQAA